MARTYKDGIEPGVYMFPVVKFLVDVRLNANTRSSEGFFPVHLMHIVGGFTGP